MIITLLFAMTAHAQSLADLARQERARRTNQVVAKKVFNNQTLQALLVPPPTAIDPVRLTGALDDLQGGLEALAASGLVESGSEVMEAGAGMFRQMIQGLENMEITTQQEIGRLRARLVNPLMSAAGRSEAEVELADAERVLSEVQAELADTRAKLAGLGNGPGGR